MPVVKDSVIHRLFSKKCFVLMFLRFVRPPGCLRGCLRSYLACHLQPGQQVRQLVQPRNGLNGDNALNSKSALKTSTVKLIVRDKLRLLCLIYLLSVYLLLTTPLAQASDIPKSTNSATIDFVKGYVTVFPTNDTSIAVFAKRGMRVMQTDFIVTGDDGFVSLSFRTGAVVNIQPSSEVGLDVIDCLPQAGHCHVVLRALKGNINSNIENLTNDDVEFTITTPYASAAVRGTVFDIDIDDGRLLTGVTEGQVDLSAAAGQVSLFKNFGSEVKKDEPPSEPRPLLEAPVLIPGPVRFDSSGQMAWERIALANEYLVSVNNTGGLVYREQIEDTVHPLQPLDLGTYAVHIRAIDADGFRGQTAESQFDIVNVNRSKSGPRITSSLDAGAYAVMVPEQANSLNLVELHFSPTENFERLINLDVSGGEIVSGDRPENSIYIRARGVLSNTEVTPFGPVVEVPGLLQ